MFSQVSSMPLQRFGVLLLSIVRSSIFRMLASFSPPDLEIRIEHVSVFVVVLDQEASLAPVPHGAAALYVQAFHSFRQVHLPLAVHLFELVLDFGQDFPHHRLNIVLRHQAGAQLLGYEQRKSLRLCRRQGSWWRERSDLFLRPAALGLGGGGPARGRHRRIAFGCITFDHSLFRPLRNARPIGRPYGGAGLPVSWGCCPPDCTANVQ